MQTTYRILALIFVLAAIGGASVTIICVANGEKLIGVGTMLLTIFLLSKSWKCMDIAEGIRYDNAKKKHEKGEL